METQHALDGKQKDKIKTEGEIRMWKISRDGKKHGAAVWWTKIKAAFTP
jgi:hypothetical protein